MDQESSMLKIIAGGAVAALMVLAAPGVGSAFEAGKTPTDTTPAVKQSTEQATEFSSRHRRGHRPRYVRPYYRPYGYYPQPYYSRPYYQPYGYYGNPYRRQPGVYFGFGF
jgi:hypothetical protein